MLYLLLPCDDFLIIIIIYHMIKLLCASRLEAEIMVRKLELAGTASIRLKNLISIK